MEACLHLPFQNHIQIRRGAPVMRKRTSQMNGQNSNKGPRATVKSSACSHWGIFFGYFFGCLSFYTILHSTGAVAQTEFAHLFLMSREAQSSTSEQRGHINVDLAGLMHSEGTPRELLNDVPVMCLQCTHITGTQAKA